MHFNHRILEEAARDAVPVLERMTFLGIYSNNLDEFFRVRVASVRRMALCKDKQAKEEADKASRLLAKINRLNARYALEYQSTVAAVERTLDDNGIRIVDDKSADETQRAFVRTFFRQRLAGRVLPIWLENIRHFDKEADDSIYLIVRLRRDEKKSVSAIVPVPVDVTGRWVTLPDDAAGKHCVMYVDDVVRLCLRQVFPGLECGQMEAYSFKFTRDAEMDIDNDLTKGFMQKISKGVSSRKAGVPLRLVYDSDMPGGLLRRIVSRLDGNGKLDTAIAGGRYQNHRDMMRFPDFGRKDLKYPEWMPVAAPWAIADESVFDAVRRQDRVLHVPYQSFDGYLRLLGEAAVNPKVKSVKTTLYRLAKNSKVITALICAAQNGKKVTVVIELLARFDEASNISWSKKMQDAGITVVFGVEGLKIHSKITHISFTSGTSIACVSTGNFHEGNAVAYTDLLLMTARRNITSEVDRVFKFIEQPYVPVHFKELLVSPNDMRRRFLAMIDAEMRNHLAGRPAYIKAKVNHVTDPALVAKIYDAARAGVRVDLLVRGNCALTDNEALGGNLRVVRVIDRYLEHSRIYRFGNGGDERVFIGSADWMPRNLDCRIEVVTPVYDEAVKAECQRIVDYGLSDTVQGQCVVGEGQEQPQGQTFRSQEALHDYYNKTATNDDL